MKKVLITIFIHFYLFSALGYTSVQHYCQMMQTTIEGGTDECCCSTESIDGERCHVEAESDACCNSEKKHRPSDELDTILTVEVKDCCETKADHNFVDSIPLSNNGEIHVMVTQQSSYTIASEAILQFSQKKQIPHCDPSDHINTPLII